MIGFVYKWVNNTNGKWYTGSHKGTTDDGYKASGIAINRAFSKHGIDNFTRHILYVGKDYRLVEELSLESHNAMNDKNSYNMKNDSIGGWDHINSKGLNIHKHINRKPTSDFSNSEYHQSKHRPGIWEEITINGIYFESKSKAAEHFGCSRSKISSFIKSNEVVFEMKKTGPQKGYKHTQEAIAKMCKPKVRKEGVAKW